MPDAIHSLRYTNDFMSIDVTEDNSEETLSQTGVNLVGTTKIAYREGTGIDDPTGTWVVGDRRLDAGTVVISSLYNSWLNANNRAQTHLSAMAANSALAKASSAMATALGTRADDNTTTSLSYQELLAIAQTAITANNVGMTAEAFVTRVLPDVSAASSFQKSDFRGLADTVSQYSNGRLTDNSVLQQKYEVAAATINTIQEAMSNVMKAWTSNLQSLAKGL